MLLGLPTGWRELERDAVADTKLHDVIKMADIVHPWTPGRYKTLKSADKHKEDYTIKDQQWCRWNPTGQMSKTKILERVNDARLIGRTDPELLVHLDRLKHEGNGPG